VAVPDGAVQVNFAAGRAEMQVNNLPMDDYFNLPNALADGPEVDAIASFDVVWEGPVTRRLTVQDGTNGNQFAGEFVENQATVTWSARNELGFSFQSNSGDFSTSAPGRAFAELGHERNGTFVPQGSSSAAALAQALSMPLTRGVNSALPQVSAALAAGATDLAPPHGKSEGQPPKSAVASDPAPAVGAGARTAPPSAIATALFTEIGQQGLDILFR
jgi:hypothetical protein